MAEQMLQSVAQSLQWTYSLFWQLCPKQGVLVWADGYYNGARRTWGTVQRPSERTKEKAYLRRSQQLRELYESLSAGETNLQSEQQPCRVLSPEDLTDAEWFYLMCMSFAFPPGSGLPGNAYQRQEPIWLSRASEADRKVFPRALLAKSAQIRTVICIPLTNGVLELGTIDKVDEDLALIQHVRSFFMGQHVGLIHYNKPTAVSELSTSNPTMSATGQQLFHLLPLSTMHSPTNLEKEFDDEIDDHEDNDPRVQSINFDSNVGVGNKREDMVAMTTHIAGGMAVVEPTIAQVELTELKQREMPEEILWSSTEHISDNLHSSLAMGCMTSHTGQSHRVWPLDNDATDMNSHCSGATRSVEDMPQNDAHYFLIVSTILRRNFLAPKVGFGPDDRLQRHPQQSAFNSWTCQRDSTLLTQHGGNPRWLLKYILCKVPYSYEWGKVQSMLVQRNTEEASINFSKSMPQDESSTDHVMAERKRREKLKERFLVLKSLVPITKMDKASVLSDTIEYIKQLLRRIQDYETKMQSMEGEKRKGAS